MREASPGSSVVTERNALAWPRAAAGAIRSRSRTISADFVTMLNGCSHETSSSRIPRMIRSFRSIGWYGSVLVPNAIDWHR